MPSEIETLYTQFATVLAASDLLIGVQLVDDTLEFGYKGNDSLATKGGILAGVTFNLNANGHLMMDFGRMSATSSDVDAQFAVHDQTQGSMKNLPLEGEICAKLQATVTAKADFNLLSFAQVLKDSLGAASDSYIFNLLGDFSSSVSEEISDATPLL